MSATAATEAKWTERVREWRTSGLTAAQYVEGKGFEASTLRFWASRLGQPAAKSPRLVELVPVARRAAGSAMVAATVSAELVIEVGVARVRVGRGFDHELLAEVVDVLHGGAR